MEAQAWPASLDKLPSYAPSNDDDDDDDDDDYHDYYGDADLYEYHKNAVLISEW